MYVLTLGQRKDVANRLREYAKTYRRYNPFWCVKDAVFNDVQAHSAGEVLSVLADLIDPVCKNQIANNCGTFECSKCGTQWKAIPVFIGPDWTLEHDSVIPSYCPRCGARIVEVK